MNKHNKIIRNLEQRLLHSPIMYDCLVKNLEYGHKSRLIGEIDLLAVHHSRTKSYCLAFEVKTTDSDKHYSTAKKQLRRMKKRFIDKDSRNYFFYVCGTKRGDYCLRQVKL